MKISHILLFLVSVGLMSCGGKKFTKQPIDVIINVIPTNQVFSIILHDMDVEGTFFKKYKHQYKVIVDKEQGRPTERLTQWYEVGKDFFVRNQNNMGMTLASRSENGKLKKSVSPPGYNNYVGNSRYGYWNRSGGSSFWAFYGQYAFMSRMFGMLDRPVRRSYYDDYSRNYQGTGRSYYGPTVGGRSIYGTNSAYNTKNRANSAWGRNTSSFKQRVNNRVSRSSSRYGGTSSRSRGGGFGK